jgi:hypothetical protein
MMPQPNNVAPNVVRIDSKPSIRIRPYNSAG